MESFEDSTRLAAARRADGRTLRLFCAQLCGAHNEWNKAGAMPIRCGIRGGTLDGPHLCGAVSSRKERQRRCQAAWEFFEDRGMSLARRIIPCLDVDGARVVKGVNFIGLRDAGDPAELAARYNA